MKQELVPIFRIPKSNPEHVDAHATGTLIHVDGIHLLATASHVFRHDDLGALLLGAASGNIVLAGQAITVDPAGNDRELDPIDFGVVLLSDIGSDHVVKPGGRPLYIVQNLSCIGGGNGAA